MENRSRRNLLLWSSLGLVGLALLALLWPLWWVPGILPSHQTLMSSKIVDRHGVPIQIPLNQREERSKLLTLDEVPATLQHAFLFAEDRRFFDHPGIDPLALLRATYQSLGKMKIVSGASTISMQVARIYWPELGRPRSKLAQMVQAIRLEMNHTKSELLTHYFNIIPFAYQTIGLGQACIKFFDKECSALSLAESATLAVLPRNPNYYINNQMELVKTRNALIEKVAQSLQVPPLVKKQALQEPLQFRFGTSQSYAYHFAQKVIQQNKNLGIKTLETTLDLELQKSIQKLVQQNIATTPLLGDAASVLVVENKSGNVIAYIGSPNYFADGHGMLDAVHSLRSPGSTLKPFLYLYALNRGWTLSSLIPDVPMKFKVEKGIFSPNNYGGNFSGPQQIRFALANSKNIPALYMTALLGEAYVLSFFKDIGLSSLTKNSKHYGVGLSLGNGEVSLWELVQSYSSLARGGVFKPLKIMTSTKTTGEKRLFSEENAYLISSVLSDPQARSEEFGRGGSLEFDFDMAIKTGTSSQFRDHWILGYSSQYTIGIWKGNADGSPLHHQVPSSRGAGPLFKQIVKLVHQNQFPRPFTRPSQIVEKRVCNLSGMKPSPQCQGTRLEFFHKNHSPNETCPYHKIKQISNCNGSAQALTYLDLPRKYSTWAEANKLPTLERQVAEQCGLDSLSVEKVLSDSLPKILEPLDGAVYAFDPTIPSSHQKLRFQFLYTQGRSNVSLYVNDQFYQSIKDRTSLDWPVQRGEFQFQIRYGKNFTSDTVKFKVL